MYILLNIVAQRGAVGMGLFEDIDPHTKKEHGPSRHRDGGAVASKLPAVSELRASINMS